VDLRHADDYGGNCSTLNTTPETALYIAVVLYVKRKIALGEFAGPPLFYNGAVPYVEPRRTHKGRRYPMPPHRGLGLAPSFEWMDIPGEPGWDDYHPGGGS
jgi:hypothetical protein